MKAHDLHHLKYRQNSTSVVPQVNVHNVPNQHVIYNLFWLARPACMEQAMPNPISPRVYQLPKGGEARLAGLNKLFIGDLIFGETVYLTQKSGSPFQCPEIILFVAIVPGTLAIPCIHPYFWKQRAGCNQQAQLIHLSLSKVCSTNFSGIALHPSESSTPICESPARCSIFMSHARKLVPLCQIFHLRASFRQHLPLAY
jgi:hypothetical protein